MVDLGQREAEYLFRLLLFLSGTYNFFMYSAPLKFQAFKICTKKMLPNLAAFSI